jgi:poly(A) polymerase/tRNA nucleotidyltransferase (CCA-adding enzyme)
MTEATLARIDETLAGALPPGSLYAVGGRVRDELRSEFDGRQRIAKDLDYVVVGLAFDDVVAALERVARTDVVGASFAVVKVTLEGATVDVALARREHSTGAGHRDFAVESGPEVTLDEDLARRDFRMNMMARRLSDGALVDPYGGAADVRARQIDLLRVEAFVEDPLRMLRACQFAARFDYAVTARTMDAMRAAAPLVATVSPERIRDELAKFMTYAERPSIGLELMRAGGLLPFVLPEIAEGIGVEQNEYHAYDVYRHNLATLDATPPGDLALRVAALLHDVGKPRTKDGPHFYRHELVGADIATDLLSRLRFSNEHVEAVTRLVRHHMYAADPSQEARTMRRFIRRVGTDLLERQFALRAADIVGSGLPKRGPENEAFQAKVWEIVAEKPALSVRDLKIDGTDVIAALVAAGQLPRGSRGGPAVGALLGKLLDTVLDDPTANEPVRLARELDRLLRESVPRETGHSNVSCETEGEGVS